MRLLIFEACGWALEVFLGSYFMFKGPRIRAAGYPQRRVRASHAMRLGVPFFCVVVAILAAVLSSPGYGQTGTDFSQNFFSDSSRAIDRVKKPVSEVLSTPVVLTPEQRAIGLAPVSEFFSSSKAMGPKAMGNAQLSAPQESAFPQGADEGLTHPVQSHMDSMLQQEAKDFWTRISEATSRISPRSDRILSENGTLRARGVVGERNSGNLAQGYVGGGVLMTPVYVGSNEYRYLPTSFIHLEIADAFRVTDDDGFELVPFKGLPIEIALGLNWREGRLPNGNLKGLDGYDMTITVGGELAIALGELELFTDVEKGFLGGNKGLQIESGVKTRYLRLYDEVDVGGRLSATWADEESMGSEFSVSASEAEAIGISVYDAKGGVRDISLSLEAFYYLTPNLGLHAAVDAELLVANAMHSPIVKTEGHPLQLKSNLGLVYRF